ncbi:MAG: putative Splicing factor 3A subunit [Streblomastix strix]|uniref:Putative Splicing factor 3A subunit n=1 Tax=Streblomastix strix TaxID=222440 RepID=A0A5J4X1U5_9EUKA|nr:MAG: putative Splicing factor 3A subunit [Streblomastix strix]
MLDRENWGGKTGSGGPASEEWQNIDRKERLRKLAIETADLSKDPYFMKNYLGQFECKLCFTVHLTEANYLAHTQAKRHQENLAKIAFQKSKEQTSAAQMYNQKKKIQSIRKTAKIGIPGYTITKQQDPASKQFGLLVQIDYSQINEGIQPRYRIMSAYEQHKETPDKNFQYLLFAAEPYDTIAIKIPNWQIERGGEGEGKPYTHFDDESKIFTLSLTFKPRSDDSKDANQSKQK